MIFLNEGLKLNEYILLWQVQFMELEIVFSAIYFQH